MSLYGLSKDVQDLLHAKRFPLRVHYGPERMHREGYPENVIIFERDRTADDSVGEPRGVQRNPRKMRVRGLQSVATLYVRNSRAGARVEDHETLCEKFVDALLVAIETWAKASGAVECPITGSRYLSEEERLSDAKRHAPGVAAQAIEQWPGAVYRVRFTVPRALLDLNYAGDGLPTGTLAAPGITSRTDATGPGFDEAETGCGDPDP
jgi:hypothetical protein